MATFSIFFNDPFCRYPGIRFIFSLIVECSSSGIYQGGFFKIQSCYHTVRPKCKKPIRTSHVFLCTRLVTWLRGDVSAYHSYQRCFLKVRSTKQQKSNDIQVTESQNHKVNWRHCAVWHVKTSEIFVKDLISTPLSSSPFHPFTRHRMSPFRGNNPELFGSGCRFGRTSHTKAITSERIPTKADRSFGV